MCYVEYYSCEHLRLVYHGWKELNCLYVDGLVFIKMVSL